MEEVNAQCTTCSWVGDVDDLDASEGLSCPVCGANIEEYVADENDQDGYPDY